MFDRLLLNPRLLKALTELGFERPTEVQAEVIPLAIRRRDVMASAPTGSGKTLAYLLPLLHRLLTKSARKQGSRALVLVPTRELAKQVWLQCDQLTHHTKLDAEVIAGGDDIKRQTEALARHPEIVIATPGRLLEHIEARHADFSGLEVLVLDEADRMLDMGMGPEVEQVVHACHVERQTMLFSATLNQPGMDEVAEVLMNEPERVDLGGVREVHEDITQQMILADDLAHKERLLDWVLTHEAFDRALVFCNSRDHADRVSAFLIHHQYRAGVLHGSQLQGRRSRALELFREGKLKVLVTTDVAARGLDIKGVGLVVNFDMARSGDDHVHRVGRTGRGGEQGLAITLVNAQEWNVKAGVERYLRFSFERRVIKELEGTFKGPKRLKASGKAAGSKKKPPKGKAAAKGAKKRKG